MSWNTLIHRDILPEIEKFSPSTQSTLFSFVQDLPLALSTPSQLSNAKIKQHGDIWLFVKNEAEGLLKLYIHIDFAEKKLALLHITRPTTLRIKKKKSRSL